MILRDYTHASKTFLTQPGYTMAPKLGFLFHVRLVFNAVGQSQNGEQSKTISVLIKNVDLPKFRMSVEDINKYNRREPVQTKLNYEPVIINFHDDMENNIRDMWLAYNSYYFADIGVTEEAWHQDNTYVSNRLANRYGLDTDKTEPFLKSVDIYSMGNHIYTKYSLLNPIISSFEFDNHDYAEGSKVMGASMRLEYESVLYYQGSTENIPGFGIDSPYYDNRFSTLGASVGIDSRSIIDAIEEIIGVVAAPVQTVQSFFDEIVNLPIQFDNSLFGTVKTVAANSLSGNARFSFPTATTLTDVSSLVELDKKKRKNFKEEITINGTVTSNGDNIKIIQNFGSVTTVTEIIPSLVVYPKIPDNLSPVERVEFSVSFPPLPTTDPRTRASPYV